MDRRHFLGVSAGMLSGCLNLRAGAGDEADMEVGVGTDVTPTGTPRDGSPNGSIDVASSGFPPTICDGEIHEGRFPAIVEPVFADDWVGIDVPAQWEITLGVDPEVAARRGLPDRERVIGVARDGVARAYPLAVLFWHEVVNDTFDLPVMVTFCPDCSSGLVAERTIGGRESIFGVTGQRWRPPDGQGEGAIASGRVFPAANVNDTAGITPSNNANLVMFDEATRSFWSQLLAKAICGPMTGERLSLLPATFTSWGAWRASHPETSILLPPPYSTMITDPDRNRSDASI